MKKLALLAIVGVALGSLCASRSSLHSADLAFSSVAGPSGLATRIARLFPAVAGKLSDLARFEPVSLEAGGTSLVGFRRASSETTSPGPDRGRARSVAVSAFFPESYGAPFVAEGFGARVVYRPLGASLSRAEIAGGKVIYSGAYPETDLLYRVESGRIEEFMLLRSSAAPLRFEYRIEETAGIEHVRLESGAIRFVNGEGQGLVIERPWLLDANGEDGENAVWWELEREPDGSVRSFRLQIDPEGLTYPLLVDPSWSSTGDLVVPRRNHSAVLLQTGKVLVVEGGASLPRVPELYDPVNGTWTTTNAHSVGHLRGTATVLRSGKVLVAGGFDAGNPTLKAELYDPANGTWSSTGDMNVPRAQHTATLLTDGKVLVAGGITTGSVITQSSEIYDPATGTWEQVGDLNDPRHSHTATLLQDGKVLVAGGNDGAALLSAEMFDPGTAGWSLVRDMLSPRTGHTATLLRDGTVLVVSGSTSELYDPAGDTWTQQLLPASRTDHTATLLPDGRLLVVGGDTAEGTVLVYAFGSWSTLGSLITPRVDHTATLLPDGSVLVAGGFRSVTLQSAEILHYANGTWTSTTDPSTARDLHTVTPLPANRVLVAGGLGAGTSVEIYDVASNSWSGANPMNEPRYGHSATLLVNAKVLVAGGFGSTSHLTGAELFDPDAGLWEMTGSMLRERSQHTAVLLADGRVLVAGGTNGSPLAEAEIYDPVNGTWTLTDPLLEARWMHTATLLKDGRVLVTGGEGLSGPLATVEIYDPSTGTWSPGKTLAAPRYGHRANLLPNGKVLVSGGYDGISALVDADIYDPGSDSWTPTAPLLGARSAHFSLLLPGGWVLVAGGFNDSALLSAELFDPALGKWFGTADLNITRYWQYQGGTVLRNGRVMVVGGSDDAGPLRSAEIYDVGLGFLSAWRPTLSNTTHPLVEGSPLDVTGSSFQGLSEASGGDGEQSSPTNYPLVQVRRIDNECIRWIRPDPGSGWTPTSFRSEVQNGLQAGPAIVTVFTNAIPSVSKGLAQQCAPPVIVSHPVSQTDCEGGMVSFSVNADGEGLSYQWRKNGQPIVDGGHYQGSQTDTLTVSPIDSSDVANYDVMVGSACSDASAISDPASLSMDHLPPTFDGVESAINLDSPCRVELTWSAGTSNCSLAPDITYNVYRSTTSGFVPGAGNLIASCVTGTSFADSAGLVSGETYYYVVRAEDSGSGLGGPCNDGMEDFNAVEASVPVSCSSATTEPNPVQFFTASSTDGNNKLEWLNPSSGPYAGTMIRYRTDGFPASPTDGTEIANQNDGLGAYGFFNHPATNGTTYYYAAFVHDGANFSTPRYVKGRPFDTAVTPVEWAFSTGAAALTPPAVGSVYAVSNDRVLYGIVPGAGGGFWPFGWTPFAMNAPAQERPPVVPVSVMGASKVIFLGSQDGHVYAVDADTGSPLWTSLKLGDMVQAAPAGMFTAFDGAYDLILVGTRNSGGLNKLFALHLADGTEAWRFGDVAPFDIGIIGGKAAVDYATNRVYFASRADGTLDTLWALNFTDLAANYFWSQPLGDIEGSPTLRNGVLYVGTNASLVYAVDADSGTPIWSFDCADGPIKGFVWPDSGSGLYLSTTGKVWSLTDDGPTYSLNWMLATIPSPSVPLLVPGTNYLYVGSSDGHLYQIDVTTQAVVSVQLGDGTAAVGSPSFDVVNGVVYVGTDAGVVYAVTVPF